MPPVAPRHPIVALLHGFTGCPESWDPVTALLPDDLEVLRPTLRGHDPARIDEEGIGFEDEVDRLAHWLTERAEPPMHLAGYSMGGRLALGLLVRHRRLFDSATLIGVHPGIADPEERRRRRASDEALARRLESRGVEDFVDRWQELPLFATQRRLPAAVRERQRTLRLRHRPSGLALALRTVGAAAMPDYRPYLPRLDLPIRLLAGASDDKFRRIARAMARSLPQGSVEIVPGAGHNLILEAPRAVAAAILRAIAPAPGTPARSR